MDITIIRGRTIRLKINLTYNGEPYEPGEGEKVIFTIKKSVYDTEPVLQKEGTYITIAPADTENIEPRYYVYDVVLWRSADEIFTVVPIEGAAGNIRVVKGVYE